MRYFEMGPSHELFKRLVINVHPAHDVFQDLVKSRVIKTGAARNHLDHDTLDRLVKGNILSMHPNETYTFQARHVETFFQLKLGTICKGTVLPLLMKDSAVSRMRQPFEVGDVDDEGGVEFLMTNYKRSREVAEEAVKEVTGGRFSLLNQVGSSLRDGDTVSEIRDVYHVNTAVWLTEINVDPGHGLFQDLVKSRVIKTGAARSHLDPDTLDKLDVLAMHPNRTYTFQARHVETFFQTFRRFILFGDDVSRVYH